MFRSALRLVTVAAALAIAAVVASFHRFELARCWACEKVAHATGWLGAHLVAAARLAPVKAGIVHTEPERQRVRADAKAVDLVQRRRPAIELGWRMCPSA